MIGDIRKALRNDIQPLDAGIVIQVVGVHTISALEGRGAQGGIEIVGETVGDSSEAQAN